MLFTTATFVLLFLPVVLTGFFLLGRRSESLAAAWLFAASLFFYGYWMPEFTLLLLASIAINFAFGLQIGRARGSGRRVGRHSAAGLWQMTGVAFNLALLGYFKYANFFVESLNAGLGFDWQPGHIILPIGISFYTFTQIAFLVDTGQGKVTEFRPIHYGLFVTYFPHLIAGPVLHHGQMMPQFASSPVRLSTVSTPPTSRRELLSSVSVCSRRSFLPTALRPTQMPSSYLPTAAPRPVSGRVGWAPLPTACNSTSTSPATRTWR